MIPPFFLIQSTRQNPYLLFFKHKWSSFLCATYTIKTKRFSHLVSCDFGRLNPSPAQTPNTKLKKLAQKSIIIISDSLILRPYGLQNSAFLILCTISYPRGLAKNFAIPNETTASGYSSACSAKNLLIRSQREVSFLSL